LPLPRINCQGRQICLSKDPKDQRLRSSLLIDNRILVDCGPDVYTQLLRAGMPVIEAIIFTHRHGDHINGFKLNFKEPQTAEVKLYGPKEVFKRIRNEYKFKNSAHIYKNGEALDFDAFTVNPLKIDHEGLDNYGLLISTNKRLFYAPDIEAIPKITLEVIKEADILVVDGSILNGPHYGHIGIDRLLEIIKPLNKETYFTHIGIGNPPHKELVKYVKEKGGDNFNVAFDGMELEI